MAETSFILESLTAGYNEYASAQAAIKRAEEQKRQMKDKFELYKNGIEEGIKKINPYLLPNHQLKFRSLQYGSQLQVDVHFGSGGLADRVIVADLGDEPSFMLRQGTDDGNGRGKQIGDSATTVEGILAVLARECGRSGLVKPPAAPAVSL